MTEKLNHPLWQHMLTCYALPGVKDLCLRLQNEADMDVLLILAGIYWQQSGSGCPQAHDLKEYVCWREQVILPIRSVRMKLAKSQQPLRSQLLASELSAEQQAAELLAQLPKTALTEAQPIIHHSYAYLSAQFHPQAQILWPLLLQLLGDSLIKPMQ